MGKGKIYLVEDYEDMVVIIEEMLDNLGYELQGVSSNYEAALKDMEASIPDLVLLDIFLKGEKKGTDLAQEIRRRHPKLPIIFTTSADDDWIIRNLLQDVRELEPCECLHKPIEQDKLGDMLGNYLATSASSL